MTEAEWLSLREEDVFEAVEALPRLSAEVRDGLRAEIIDAWRWVANDSPETGLMQLVLLNDAEREEIAWGVLDAFVELKEYGEEAEAELRQRYAPAAQEAWRARARSHSLMALTEDLRLLRPEERVPEDILAVFRSLVRWNPAVALDAWSEMESTDRAAVPVGEVRNALAKLKSTDLETFFLSLDGYPEESWPEVTQQELAELMSSPRSVVRMRAIAISARVTRGARMGTGVEAVPLPVIGM